MAETTSIFFFPLTSGLLQTAVVGGSSLSLNQTITAIPHLADAPPANGDAS